MASEKTGIRHAMRILVVSETGNVGGILAQQLGRTGIPFDQAAKADFRAYVQAYTYAALLLALPAPAGLLATIRRRGDKLPLLAFSTGDSAARAELYELGADDVLAPSCQAEELAARIRAVVRRHCGYASSELIAGAARLRLGRMEVALRDTVVPLTPKEYGILELLFLRPGQVHAKATIMNHIYGAEEEPAVRTLDVIVCKLRKKLAVHGAPELVATVWGSGLALRELSPEGAALTSALPQLDAA